MSECSCDGHHIRPMLAESIANDADLTRYEGTHFAQVKHDGTRIIAHVEHENIRMISRSGKNDFSGLYPEICDELAAIRGTCVLDCELTFWGIGEAHCTYVKADALPETRAGYIPRLMVFDVIRHGQTDMRDLSQEERSMCVLGLLDELRMHHVRPVDTFLTEFRSVYETVVSFGGEGIILKDKSAKYRHDGVNGNRSRAWLKVKRSETADCVVMGLQKGKGKTESTFGALILGQYENGVLREVGRSSGMTDAERRDLCDLIMDIPRYPHFSTGLAKIQRSVIPEVVVEIECMERTDDGMMRHPRFIRVRNDKSPRECVYDP